MPPARILIDCTSSYLTGLNTGIQRVVRNIVGRCDRATDNLGIPCIPLVFRKGEAYTFRRIHGVQPAGVFQSGTAVRLQTLQRLLDNWRQRATLLLYRSRSAPIRLACKAARFVIRISRVLLRTVAILLSVRTFRRLVPLTVTRDDLLLMPDSFWDFNVVEAARRAAQAGARVIPVIHDLIPVTHPQFCSPLHIRNFESNLETLLRSSAAILTVSGSMDREIRAWLSNNPTVAGKPMPTDYFYHGADFTTEYSDNKNSSSVRKDLRDLFSAAYPVYLVVGTLEPRKAQDQVLDAFEHLWANGTDLRLCFIGRASTTYKQFQHIAAHPKLGKSLFLFHDLSDRELEYAYRHCTALIFASRVEGFGIPLIEAMHYGVPVMANDIPVFREIAGNYPTYFSVDNLPTLIDAVRDFETQRGDSLCPRMPNRQWLTWDESATSYFRKALVLHARVQAADTLSGGAVAR